MRTMTKRLAYLATALALAAALPAGAQQPKPQKLPELQPVPEPPPPPPGYEPDPALEPQVTIIQRGADTVEEYRINGRLYMMRVTPPRGRPYYLVDLEGHGQFVRRDDLHPSVRPPMWVIHQW